MAGLTDTFGKEKRTRFLEMFLPLAAGIGASFMPNGGQALQGLGTVLSGSFGRRADEAKLRQQDTEFEAMQADADSQLNALNAELARVEGTPYEYNPEWSPERNRLAAAERNAKISSLKTQIKTTGDTFAAIMRHAAQTRDPSKAIAALGVFMNSINSMTGLEDQLGLWFAKHGVEDNDEDIRLAEIKAREDERAEMSQQRQWQRTHEGAELGLRGQEMAERRAERADDDARQVAYANWNQRVRAYERAVNELQDVMLQRDITDPREAKKLLAPETQAILASGEPEPFSWPPSSAPSGQPAGSTLAGEIKRRP